MNRKAMLYVIGGLIFAGLLWWTWDRNAGGPVRELRTELKDARAELDGRMDAIRDARGAPAEIRKIGGHAIGDTPERAVHGLRVALNTIAHEAALSEISVDSRDSGPVRSPAERSKSFRQADGREAPDFHIIEGSLRGTTTLENAIRVLARVQSQDWPKQVVSASMSPRDDGELVEVSIALRTAFVPGVKTGEAVLAEAKPEWIERGEGVARDAIFSAWVAPLVAVAAPPQKPPPPDTPRKPAWDQWSITGMVDGRDGPALMVVNRNNNEQKTLRTGESLLGLVFEGVRDGAALIRGEDGLFAVLPGQSLAFRDNPITDM